MTLPKDFSDYTCQLFGNSLWQKFLQGLQEPTPVSIRLNPFKFNDDTMTLPADTTRKVEWCKEGRYLKQRPQFTFDPLLHAGAYYVQEAASMYVAKIIRQLTDPNSPLRVLDLCAAPGGKTTTLRSVLPTGSLLMANEPLRPRANILMENVQKFGHPDCIVTNNYAIDYQRSGLLFDVVVADVPCSGEGMFRKDEGAISEWSVQNVKKCAALQREIISDILPCLRNGGLLIYSTCTFNAHEDEENVRWIIDNFGLQPLTINTGESFPNTAAATLLPTNSAIHFIPGVTPTEGLFIAALRKPGNAEANLISTQTDKKKEKKLKKAKQSKGQAIQGCKQLAEWISAAPNFDITMLGGRIVAIKKSWRNIFDVASEKLRIMHAGIELAELKGKDFIPAHCLALSTALNINAFPTAELDADTAIAYLRRQPIQLPTNTPRGYVVATYQHLPLGFLKNLGNRCNNLYPQEWRIKSSRPK